MECFSHTVYTGTEGKVVSSDLVRLAFKEDKMLLRLEEDFCDHLTLVLRSIQKRMQEQAGNDSGDQAGDADSMDADQACSLTAPFGEICRRQIGACSSIQPQPVSHSATWTSVQFGDGPLLTLVGVWHTALVVVGSTTLLGIRSKTLVGMCVIHNSSGHVVTCPQHTPFYHL